MATQRLIVAIGRIERALSRLERLPDSLVSAADNDLAARHDMLRSETREAVRAMDDILAGGS